MLPEKTLKNEQAELLRGIINIIQQKMLPEIINKVTF